MLPRPFRPFPFPQAAKRVLKLMQNLEAAMAASSEGAAAHYSQLKSKLEAAESGGVTCPLLDAARRLLRRLLVAGAREELEAALKPHSDWSTSQRISILKAALDKAEMVVGPPEQAVGQVVAPLANGHLAAAAAAAAGAEAGSDGGSGQAEGGEGMSRVASSSMLSAEDGTEQEAGGHAGGGAGAGVPAPEHSSSIPALGHSNSTGRKGREAADTNGDAKAAPLHADTVAQKPLATASPHPRQRWSDSSSNTDGTTTTTTPSTTASASVVALGGAGEPESSAAGVTEAGGAGQAVAPCDDVELVSELCAVRDLVRKVVSVLAEDQRELTRLEAERSATEKAKKEQQERERAERARIEQVG